MSVSSCNIDFQGSTHIPSRVTVRYVPVMGQLRSSTVALKIHTARLVVPILANKFAFAINFETPEYILGPVVLSAA